MQANICYDVIGLIQYNFILFAAKSPIFSHISATLSGLSTIRAFQAQELLRQEFENHQDLNTGAFFMFFGMLWLFIQVKQYEWDLFL